MVVENWEQSNARERFVRNAQQNCADFFDSDITLSWEAYGTGKYLPATLLAAAPAFVRFALVDPLGRPQMMFVANGYRFTLVDNQKAEGYTGTVGGSFIQKYLPESVAREELFFWLAGRPGIAIEEVIDVAEDPESGAFWYRLQRDDFREYLVLGPEHMQRRVLQNGAGKIILDVGYDSFRRDTQGCFRPGALTIRGERLPAEFKLDFKKFYPGQRPASRLFELIIPLHFTLRQLH